MTSQWITEPIAKSPITRLALVKDRSKKRKKKINKYYVRCFVAGGNDEENVRQVRV